MQDRVRLISSAHLSITTALDYSDRWKLIDDIQYTYRGNKRKMTLSQQLWYVIVEQQKDTYFNNQLNDQFVSTVLQLLMLNR